MTMATEAPSTMLRSRRKGIRAVKNGAATAAMTAAFMIALVPLVFIVGYVLKQGISVFSWRFLTEDIPFSSRRPGGGMGPAVVGTLVITGGATAMAVPLGVLGGIYLNEYGGAGLTARALRFLAEVMTGVPSIVMGLFIYTIWVLPRKQSGLSGFAGALALACLMLPIVIRTTEEMLLLVPTDQREASYALGSRKARSIRTVVIPYALPGILSGALLAVARAAGETAPLLFTIGLVTSRNWNVFDGANTALSTQIFRNAGVFGAFPAAQDRAWGAALTLILIVFVFTLFARVITSIFSRRLTPA
jgi:phosphate transport system permease protein